MSKDPDPLRMSGLDSDAIEEAVSKRGKSVKTEIAQERVEVAKMKEERLQKKQQIPPPPSAPPPPPPPEPEKDRSQLLDKLGQYRERFPELKSRNKIGGRSTVEEIEDELHYVQQQLGSKDSNMGMQVLIACMGGLEHMNPMGLNLDGLSKVTKDNSAQFEPIIDELVIKYGANMYMAPEWRLCLAVGSMVYTVHTANSGDPRMAAALDKMHRSAPSSSSDL